MAKMTAEKNANVKDWYISNFPDDKKGLEFESFTFSEFWDKLRLGENIYSVMGLYNVKIRDSIFNGIVNCGLAKDYDSVYDTWVSSHAKPTRTHAKTIRVVIKSSLNDFTTEHTCSIVVDTIFNAIHKYYHGNKLYNLEIGSYSSFDNHSLNAYFRVELKA